MARKKTNPLVHAMKLFSQLDERDRQTLADWIRSQTATPRKVPSRKANKKAASLLPDNPEDFQSGATA